MNPQTDPQQPSPMPSSTPAPSATPASMPQSTVMSQPSPDNKPVIFIIIIIILIFLGAFYYFMLSREGNQNKSAPVVNTPKTTQSQTAAVPSLAPTIANTDGSDTQLDKDIQVINNKISGLNTDVNNVDQGLNDKAIDTGL